MGWGVCARGAGRPKRSLGELANCEGNCADRRREASASAPLAAPKARARPCPKHGRPSCTMTGEWQERERREFAAHAGLSSGGSGAPG